MSERDRDLVKALNVALRIVRLHSLENVIAQEALDELDRRLTKRMSQDRQIMIVRGQGSLLVNEEDVPLGVVPDDPAEDLVELFRSSGLGGLVFRGSWDRYAVAGLLESFALAGLGPPDDRRRRLTEEIGHRLPPGSSLTVLSPQEGLADERAERALRHALSRDTESQLSESQQADYCYARLLALAEGLELERRQGRSGLGASKLELPLRLSLARLVKSIARPAFTERLLALTVLAPLDDAVFASHSANVTCLAVALGQLLALPRRRLVALGWAAWHHDRGRDLIGRAAAVGSDREHPDTSDAHVFAGVAAALEHSPGDPCQLARVAVAAEQHPLEDGTPELPRAHRQPHLFSRLVALADGFDRLQTGTPWAPPLNRRAALLELSRDRRHPPELGDLLRELLGEYPVGTLLSLAEGELAVVVDSGSRRRDQPVVRVLLDAAGEPSLPDVRQLDAPERARIVSPQAIALDWRSATLV